MITPAIRVLPQRKIASYFIHRKKVTKIFIGNVISTVGLHAQCRLHFFADVNAAAGKHIPSNQQHHKTEGRSSISTQEHSEHKQRRGEHSIKCPVQAFVIRYVKMDGAIVARGRVYDNKQIHVVAAQYNSIHPIQNECISCEKEAS